MDEKAGVEQSLVCHCPLPFASRSELRTAVAILGLAENAIGSHAYKPMAVLKSHKVASALLASFVLLLFLSPCTRNRA